MVYEVEYWERRSLKLVIDANSKFDAVKKAQKWFIYHPDYKMNDDTNGINVNECGTRKEYEAVHSECTIMSENEFTERI